MKNIYLLFDDIKPKSDKYYKRKLKIKKAIWTYDVNGNVVGDAQIYDILQLVKYATENEWVRKLPMEINLGNTRFLDKLTYVLLEIICYYVINIKKYHIYVSYKVKKSIWSEGIKYSPLKNMGNGYDIFNKEFKFDLRGGHYRNLINFSKGNIILSKIMGDIDCFLENNGFDKVYCKQIAETMVELIGNAEEHGGDDCLVDLNVTDSEYTKNDDTNNTYYGLSAVVVNFSRNLFYGQLQKRFSDNVQLPHRYDCVKEAYENHSKHFDDDYTESDFYTISCFQHKISGNKDEMGGTGLTNLIQSLEEKSDNHDCYMISGNRLLSFKENCLNFDDNKLIGFNESNDYINKIPDKDLFESIRTYISGTVYNLSFVMKKEKEK